MDIESWLRELGLGQYAPAFSANDISPNVITLLSSDDLRELGVLSVGHRRLLLSEIDRLRVGTPTPENAGDSEMARRIRSPPADEAERRQLTVMFCDIVDSTILAGQLDPEDLRALTQSFYAACAQSIKTYDGFIAKYLGDGVLAYFGYPSAHEDDAERAARAGLDLIAAIKEGSTSLAAQLQIRIGIATGHVVVGGLVGEGSAQERSVTGETPNLAARLQSIAEPNTVVISELTRNLLGKEISVAQSAHSISKAFRLESKFGRSRKQRPWRVGSRCAEPGSLRDLWVETRSAVCSSTVSAWPGEAAAKLS
jgi:class 3 adenylate cyclase